jgi:hypothetical protein
MSKKIDIIIRPVEDREGEYLAYVKSEMLSATFSVYFRDNLFGSVALNSFSEMMRHKYGTCKVNFIISNEKVSFKNPALLDLMSFTGLKVVND